MDNKTNYFELLDGSKLEGFPYVCPSNPISNNFEIDTTGKYFSVGDKPKKTSSEKKFNDQAIFYENVYLFLANADRILNDSRLFLTPVPVQNGLAYTGTSGFLKPTLGVYIEWWILYKQHSFDRNNRPIWFISGSPLSGAHACSVVDAKGNKHRAALNGMFLDVWSTFTKVNTRYDDAKSRFIAFSLEEAVALLRKETDEKRLFRLHVRMEAFKYSRKIESLQNDLEYAKSINSKYRARLVDLLFEVNRKKAQVSYDKWVKLKAKARSLYEHFLERRRELRKQLRSGEIDNKTYEQTLHPLNVARQDAEFNVFEYENLGIKEVFGDDAYLFSFNDIGNMLKEKNNGI